LPPARLEARADERVRDDDVELPTHVPLAVKDEAGRDLEPRREVRAQEPTDDLLATDAELTGMRDHALSEVLAHPFAGAGQHVVEAKCLHSPQSNYETPCPASAAGRDRRDRSTHHCHRARVARCRS